MAKSKDSGGRFANLILAQLPEKRLDGFGGDLERIELEIKQPIYNPNQPIPHVYFIESGMISVVSIMQDGSCIEVGTIGKEGMAGAFLLLGAMAVPYQYFVQLAGYAHRMAADKLPAEAGQDHRLRDLILRYQATFHTQTMQIAACNGLHSVQQRCCRWLLMSEDRTKLGKLALTHEFLGLMLGVRRASVSEVLRPLQERGWITSKRGEITILDRKGVESGSCECYQIIAEQQNQLLQ